MRCTARGRDVRRTYRMANCKKRGIKSPRGNKIDVELGTGKNTEGGRPTSWGYTDDEGNAHWTRGNPAQPYLAPAVKDHVQTYRNILEDEFKNGGH